jgi:bifunctional NMN adenylyltransferase/nudix hydrolase
MNELKTVAEDVECGVIIARFQSPFLHDGHIDILNRVTSNHPRVIVFLGLSFLKCTINNPLDYAARKFMLEEKYPNVEVYYIEDVCDSELWSKNLDRQIAKLLGPKLKVVLYGSRDSFIKSYFGKYPTIELVPNKFISASEIRKKVGIKSKHTQDFREGVVYALENQYPSFKPTVDAAIVNFATNEVLLAKKPGETLLRFPGGFMDPSQDKSAEDAIIREVKEETTLVTKIESYIGSTLIDDIRYRREQDKIITFLYAMRYENGIPEATDDIEYVTWQKIGLVIGSEIIPDHRPLWNMFQIWYVNKLQK